MSNFDLYWSNSATASVLSSYRRGDVVEVKPGSNTQLPPLRRRAAPLDVDSTVERFQRTMGRQEGLDLAERYSKTAEREELRTFWSQVLERLKAA